MHLSGLWMPSALLQPQSPEKHKIFLYKVSKKVFFVCVGVIFVLTLALASLAASASAAMALCSCTGSRTSLLQRKKKRNGKKNQRTKKERMGVKELGVWRKHSEHDSGPGPHMSKYS